MWNEITYEPRRLFFHGRLDEKAMEEIWKKYYESYKGVLKVNAGQA